MPLALSDYDKQVGHHLRMLHHHAHCMVTHTQLMTHQPDFATTAEEDLVRAELSVTQAAALIRLALENFRSKPRDV